MPLSEATEIRFGASIFIAPYMTSRAPSRVAAIVAKLSTWVSSGRTQATGTPERETIADILAPVRELKSVSNFRSASTATGTRLPPNRLAMQPSLFSSCSGKTGCTGQKETTAGGKVGLEWEDAARAHPGREDLDFHPRLERCGERAFVEAGDPGGNRLHPDFMRLRDGRGHQSRAERGVQDAAGPDRTVSLDHDVAQGLAARPRLKAPRTFDGREEVALVDIAAGLPERTIESRRQVACPRCRGPGRSNLSELETPNGRLRRLALDVVQDRPREHPELRV